MQSRVIEIQLGILAQTWSSPCSVSPHLLVIHNTPSAPLFRALQLQSSGPKGVVPDSCLCCAGRKGQFGLVDELTLGQILQRMMGYNVVAVLNQFVTTAAFPGVSRALAKSYVRNVP